MKLISNLSVASAIKMKLDLRLACDCLNFKAKLAYTRHVVMSRLLIVSISVPTATDNETKNDNHPNDFVDFGYAIGGRKLCSNTLFLFVLPFFKCIVFLRPWRKKGTFASTIPTS